MSDPQIPPSPDPRRPPSFSTSRQAVSGADKVLCERCSTEMFRMHAVWRCPSCGFKTDCCGW
jgi:rubrerythrin